MTSDEYEQGAYVYFDYNIVHDDMQVGGAGRRGAGRGGAGRVLLRLWGRGERGGCGYGERGNAREVWNGWARGVTSGRFGAVGFRCSCVKRALAGRLPSNHFAS